MRLKSIKLAGFKSFVDATTVPFPSNLSAIVGPNGCGKSNIIDAVRWVMGESSARYLRGESMADVIFNGSSGRKAVGQASIELIFDNSDASLGGEYARYAEIGVRRQVNRDGKSDYFLNNSRCRRKDITDIFLGTGLGPRSYAIIEQGMISRLIEARPEELRVYIEEAAGISRYKERRKETETRLTNTRDNLARLNDIRDELTRQLSHLQKQADAAEKYRALKTEERQTKIELFAWRWQTIQQELAQYELQIQQQAEQLAQSLDQQQHLEAALVLERQKEEQAHQDLHGAQNHVYGVANSINQNQQQIAHLQQHRQQLLQQQQSVVLRQQQAQQESVQDAEEWAMLDAQLNELKPVLDELHALLAEQNSQLFDAEQNLLQQQQAYEIKQQQIAQSTSQVQVWQAKVQAYEQALLRSQERQQRYHRLRAHGRQSGEHRHDTRQHCPPPRIGRRIPSVPVGFAAFAFHAVPGRRTVSDKAVQFERTRPGVHGDRPWSELYLPLQPHDRHIRVWRSSGGVQHAARCCPLPLCLLLAPVSDRIGHPQRAR